MRKLKISLMHKQVPIRDGKQHSQLGNVCLWYMMTQVTRPGDRIEPRTQAGRDGQGQAETMVMR